MSEPTCALPASFCGCGPPSDAMLLGAILGGALAIVALGLLLLRRRIPTVVLSVLGFLVAVVVLALGPMGRTEQRHVIDDATSGVTLTADERGRLLAHGYADAAQCVNAGLEVGLPLLLASLALLAGALVRRGRAAPAR